MINPLTIFGDHDEGTVSQMWRCIGAGGTRAVLCADGHKGYAQPVGGVVAYEEHISVSGVGFDIGCGNTAIETDMEMHDIQARIPTILADIGKRISFGVGRPAILKVQHEVLDEIAAHGDPIVRSLADKAAAQVGTVGGGNHYVDLFYDATHLDNPEFGGTEMDARVWIGVHFGSRGFGHTIAKEFLKLAGGKDGMDVAPTLLHQDSDLGQRYLQAMKLAGKYAHAGRLVVVDTIRRLLAARVLRVVNNHHNYAWRETHDGADYWVVRKGATPAFPGQEGFVGGSMGDDAVIVEGVDSEASRNALYSTVHGAGRIMSRSQAKKTFNRVDMDAWLQRRGVRLIGGDLDESPMAYRRLNEVLEHHAGTIRVKNLLRPFAVMMAGRGDFDPYKD